MSVLKLFLLVAGMAALSFGGGNALQAGLYRELVQKGVLTPAQFQVGIAVGQSTPGPMASFTSAIGRAMLGVPGAAAATAALMVVSLVVVVLIRRIPSRWFRLPAVKDGLRAMNPYMGAVLFFLAYRGAHAGNLLHWAAPVLITGVVFVGRMYKAPTVILMLGAVGLGMLLQGTSFSGW
ncbi:MAG: chromate transporter [Mycobacterium leprae]